MFSFALKKIVHHRRNVFYTWTSMKYLQASGSFSKYVQNTNSDSLENTSSNSIHSSILPHSEPQDLFPGKNADEKLYAAIMDMPYYQVLDFVLTNHKKLNKMHYALALKNIHRQFSEIKEAYQAQFISNLSLDPGFQILLSLLALKSEHLDDTVVAEVFLILNDFELEGNHPTMKVYLQVLKYHLSNLPLDLLIKIVYTVEKMDSSTYHVQPIIQGIQMLIPLRREQLMSLHLEELVILLYSAGEMLSIDMNFHILRLIQKQSFEMNHLLALKLLQGLQFSKNRNYSLEKESLLLLTDEIDSYMDCQILEIINVCHHLRIYDTYLFEKIIDKTLLMTDWTTKIEVLLEMNRFRVKNVDILNDVLSISNLKNNLETLSHAQQLHFLKCFANTEVKNYAAVKDLKSLTESCIENCIPEAISDIVIYLTILGSSCDNISEYLPTQITFSEHDHFQDDKISPSSYLLQTSFFKHILAKNICGIKDDISINKAIEFIQNTIYSNSSVNSLLEFIVSERGHVETGVFTPDGFIIDNLINFHDSNTKKICFLYLDESYFFVNTGQPLGFVKWYAKQLQDKDYLVSLIKESTWNRVNDQEKLLYLRNKIQYIEEDQDLILSSTDILS